MRPSSERGVPKACRDRPLKAFRGKNAGVFRVTNQRGQCRRPSHAKTPLFQGPAPEIFCVGQNFARRFVVHLGDQSMQSWFGVVDIEPVNQSV